MNSIEITDVNAANVDRLGFFCAMSKPQSEGYQRKLRWLKQRFAEGLKLKIITRGGRGFIEYIPGEYAWRGISAEHYMVIHCMWVVGRAKHRGCGKALLAECVHDAKVSGMAGVVAVSARGQLGLPPTSYFLKQGFAVVDTAPPGLDLVALRLHKASAPEFLRDWERKLQRFGQGLSVVCSPQCPYSESYISDICSVAQKCGIPAKVFRLETLHQLKEQSPSPYGSAAVVANGQVRVHLYHHMSQQRLRKLTAAAV